MVHQLSFPTLCCSLLAICLALTGCDEQTTLHSRLEERQANLVIAALMDAGIACQKVAGEEGTWDVQIAASRFADAVNLLDRNNRLQADAIVADAIARLGSRTDLLHMKDYITENTPACEKAMAEVANTNMFDGLLSIACGLGEMNYAPLLALAMERGIPMTLENTNPDNAEAARLHLEALAAR